MGMGAVEDLKRKPGIFSVIPRDWDGRHVYHCRKRPSPIKRVYVCYL